MANFRIATSSRNAVADAFGALAAGGSIAIYSGAQPASPADAPAGDTLLVTLQLGSPAFQPAVGGVISATTIDQQLAAATGAAAWARIRDAAGNAIADCDVGEAGATINLNTVNIVANGPVVITGFTVTAPAG